MLKQKDNPNQIHSSSNDNIIIDFSAYPQLFRSVQYDKFTNYLNDSEDFFRKLKYVFESLIPHVSRYTYNNITNGTSGHTHVIHDDTREMRLIKGIIKKKLENEGYEDKYIENFFINNINEYEIWQFGVIGDVRIFGTRYLNRFRPIFIDYHHLVYPSDKYNQPNYKSYGFCPIKGGCKGERSKQQC